MKQVFNGLLIVAIIVLTYLCVMSVLTPIRFEEERAKREEAVIQKLVDIRKAQIEFRRQNQRYTGSLDTLINFVKEGKAPVVLKVGVLTDEQMEKGLTEKIALTLTEKDAAKYGITDLAAFKQGFRRDTSYVSVKETVFGKDFVADNMGLVPYGEGATFEMASGVVYSGSGIEVQVFEAKTPYNVYLQGMDKQELINLNVLADKLDKYPGLKVGSIDEANNNAGNWE